MQQCPRGKYENAEDLMHEKEERNEIMTLGERRWYGLCPRGRNDGQDLDSHLTHLGHRSEVVSTFLTRLDTYLPYLPRYLGRYLPTV